MQQNGRFPTFKKRLNEMLGDMSVTEFAKKLGLSRQTVGFYLNGDRIPDVETLAQICDKCKVSADWLLGLSDFMCVDPNIHMICEYTGLSEKSIHALRYRKTAKAQGYFFSFLSALITDERLNDVFYSMQSAFYYHHVYEQCKDDFERTAQDADGETIAAISACEDYGHTAIPFDEASCLYCEQAKTLFGKIADDLCKIPIETAESIYDDLGE